MVQWDLGVLLNCLCVTLGSVESYGQTCLGRQSHTPIAFLQRKAILSEQDILAKTIRLAISDIVHVFGKYLDGMGLENDAAEICRKAWDLEIF
jgi:hypothetical protein